MKSELTLSLRERDLLLLFVGSVIGSGIFLTPGLIQRQVKDPHEFTYLLVAIALMLLGLPGYFFWSRRKAR